MGHADARLGWPASRIVTIVKTTGRIEDALAEISAISRRDFPTPE